MSARRKNREQLMMNRKTRRNGHRTIRKADIPEIETLADLSPMGQELFKLAEKIRPEELLTQKQIEKEIARRRGAVE